jgi:hypothetical protein
MSARATTRRSDKRSEKEELTMAGLLALKVWTRCQPLAAEKDNQSCRGKRSKIRGKSKNKMPQARPAAKRGEVKKSSLKGASKQMAKSMSKSSFAISREKPSARSSQQRRKSGRIGKRHLFVRRKIAVLDIKWDAKHFNQIERVAMVGDKKWQEWMAAFCKPFTTGKVRYFDHEKLDEARTWVTGN